MLSDLESPDYESIIKQQLNILMLLLSPQIVSLKFNKIYRIFRKTFFYLSLPKDEFAGVYQFYQKGSIKLKFY
jgi:hypothetical protein